MMCALREENQTTKKKKKTADTLEMFRSDYVTSGVN